MTPERTSATKRLRFGTDPALRRRFMVTDEPVRANLRVGLLLEVLDKLAEETSLSYLHRFAPQAHVVTAAMDDLEVRSAPDVDRDMLLHARVNYVGSTSMEVGIRIEQDEQPRRHIASCYFTMVARQNDRGVVVRPLSYETPEAQRRSARAQDRRAQARGTQRGYDASPEPPTLEEYRLLHDLHRASDDPAAHPLLAHDLVTGGWERTYPEYENVPQTIFGGYVIHRAYMYAHLCAEMVADQRALLVSSNRIDFYQPVRMGDKLHFESQITYTGTTSLAVETSITRISRDRTVTALSNNCLFTFVNVDAELRRLPVPPIYPRSFSEDAKYLAARRRHLDCARLLPSSHTG